MSGDEPRPPALEVLDVTAGYGPATVLRGVSITVAAGAVTALLGPNGAGKSTLLKVIGGVMGARSGRVSMFGDDVSRLTAHARARRGLCYIPEGRAVFRSLSVKENLQLQAGKGEETAAIESAVDAFPILGARLRSPAHTLSGGQQQMLAIAAAYVRNPRLIIVDEPSLGLAPMVIDQIFEFLAGAIVRGAALLVIDQFVARALALASDAYVLVRGEIVRHADATHLGVDDVFAEYVGHDQRT